MKKVTGSVLAACLIMSTSAAFGAIKEGSFAVTPVIGGYVFDGAKKLDTTFLLGLRGGYNFTKHLGVEALYDYATEADGKNGLKNISMHRFGGELLYHFLPDNVLVPYVAAGYSGVKLEGNNVNTKTHGAFDYGIGAKYFVTDDIAVRGDLRHLIYSYDDSSYNDMEFTLGAYFQFGGAEPAMKPVVAEPVAAVAAPVPAAPADSDHDGVTDTLDKCPGTPAGVAVAANGCPVDSDKDGVPDYLDKCPNTPAGEAVDAKGCPLEAAKRFCDKPAVIAIDFDTNKAIIKTKYHGELDKLGNFLKEFPDSKGTIDGYTDSTGSKALNSKLSLKRAESVRNYIIKKFGIDSKRITAKGYGSAKPVASNKTAAGRAKNRRIEAVFACK